MEVIETKTYSGLLTVDEWGEAWDILFVSSRDKPLADMLQDEIAGEMVTVRYWITDQERAKAASQTAFLNSVTGTADVDFGARYSEATGYLGTVEDIKIGGHDLLAELRTHFGQWLILEVDIHPAMAETAG